MIIKSEDLIKYPYKDLEEYLMINSLFNKDCRKLYKSNNLVRTDLISGDIKLEEQI